MLEKQEEKRLDTVKDLIKSKKYNEAKSIIINDILYKDPFNYKAYFSLAQIYFIKGNYEEAKKLYLEVLNYNNLDTYSMLQLAKICEKQDDLEEAKNILEGIVGIDYKDNFAKLELGKVYVLQDRLHDAKRLFKKILNSTKSGNHARLELGKVYILQKKDAKAEKVFNEILVTNSKDVHARLELAKLYLSKGFSNLAREHLEEIVKINKYDKFAVLSLAKLYHQEKKTDKSIKLIKDYLKHENNLFFKYELAKIYVDKTYYDDAKKILYDLLDSDIDFKTAVKLELSVLYYKIGEFRRSKDTIKKILIVEPDNLIAKYRLAKIYIKENNLNDAEKLLKEVLAVEDNLFAKYELGRVYSRQYRIVEAKEIFNSILNSERRNFVKVELARINSQLGMFSKSYRMFEEVNNTTDSNLASLGLAKAKFDQGNAYEAIDILNDILKEYPEDDYSKLELARIYSSLNEDDKAYDLLMELQSTSNKYKALTEIMFIDIKNEKYNEAMLILDKIYKLLENSDQIKCYLSYKLGLPFELKGDYYSKQLVDYSYDSFIEKMNTKTYNSHSEMIKSKFNEELSIKELYNFSNNEIQKVKPSSRTLFDKYIIDCNKVIGSANDKETTKLMVMTYSNEKNILLMYPISNEYNNSKSKKLIIN